MGRAPRVDVAGHVYHVLNRANRRATIFEKDADYDAFELILVEAVERFDLDLLSPWPLARRPGWCEWVTTPLSDREIQRLQRSIQRGAPFGDESWTESIARQYNLEMTMRPRGRPKKLTSRQNQTP